MKEISTLLVSGNLPDLTASLKANRIKYLPDLEQEYKDVSKASLYRIVKGQRVKHKKAFLVRKTVSEMIIKKEREILEDLEMSAKLNATV